MQRDVYVLSDRDVFAGHEPQFHAVHFSLSEPLAHAESIADPEQQCDLESVCDHVLDPVSVALLNNEWDAFKHPFHGAHAITQPNRVGHIFRIYLCHLEPV